MNLPNLRHRWERPLFLFFCALNIMILVAAMFIALQSAEWLQGHAFLAKYNQHLRALATAIALEPIGVTLLRNTRRAKIVGNSIPITAQQFPEVHHLFMQHCTRLGLDPPPELYFS